MDSSYFIINKGERNKDTLTIILNKGGHYSTNFYNNKRMVRMVGNDNVLTFPKIWGDSVVINELWTSFSIGISLTNFQLDTLYVNTYQGEEFIKEFNNEKFKSHRDEIELTRNIRLKKVCLP
jgi:hypothetical protein